MHRRGLEIFLITALIMVGCSAVPPREIEITKSRQLQLDNSFGVKLSQEVESYLSLRSDLNVDVYLRKVAVRLVRSHGTFSKSPVGVKLHYKRDGRWRNYGIPGIRIYLSLDLIKKAENENELAAIMSMQLAHVAHRHLLDQVGLSEQMTRQVPLQASGLPNQSLPYLINRPVIRWGPQDSFVYPMDEVVESIATAVELMYQAQYDPRGMLWLWQTYKDHSERSPYSPEQIEAFAQATYKNIVQYSPLRNPIIRTEEFTKIRERIAQL